MTVQKTTISWTNSTWNPTSGCTKVSAGCDFCYAEAINRRFGKRPFDELQCHEDRLAAAGRFRPIVTNKVRLPRMVFVNSMSDLHHEQVPDAFRHRVYAAMEANPTAIFQILTKRPGPMRRFLKERYGASGQLSENIWLGVSIEDNRVRKRIDILRDIADRHQIACAFLSVEPLIGPIDACDFSSANWVLIGGESGPRGRPMKFEWLRTAIEKARAADAAIWLKQYGNAANNPAVASIMKRDGLSAKAALEVAIRLGRELSATEKGGATFGGRLIQELPPAWYSMARKLTGDADIDDAARAIPSSRTGRMAKPPNT